MEGGLDLIAHRRNHALWVAPLLALLGFLSYFVFFVRFPALRDLPWLNLLLLLAAVALSLLALWRAFARRESYRGRVLGPLSVLFTLAVSAFFCFYIFYLSYGMPAPTAFTLSLAVAPDFSAVDHMQRPVRLADLRGKKVVLVFYRGFW